MQLKKHITKLSWAIAVGMALTAPWSVALAQPKPSPRDRGNRTLMAAAQADAANAADSQSATLQGCEVVRGAGGAKIQIRISPAVKPTVMTLTDPDRLVFDFANTVSASSRSRIEVKRDGVIAIRIGVQATTPPATRVVFDLQQPRSYELAMSGSAVTVSLGAADPAATPASASDSQVKPEQAASAAERPGADASLQQTASSPSASPASPVADEATPAPAPGPTDPVPSTTIASAGDTPAAPASAAAPAPAQQAAESKQADSTAAAGAPESPTAAQASSENANSNQPPAAPETAATAPQSAPASQKEDNSQPATTPAPGKAKEHADGPHPGNAFFALSQAQSSEAAPPPPNTQGVATVSQNSNEVTLRAEAAPPSLVAAKPESGSSVPASSPVASKLASKPAVEPALGAQQNGVNPNEYVIGEQDQLTIVVWGEPALSGPVAVRPDGKITVPLINEIKVAGMTPMELQNLLTEKLKPFINMPQVTVVVRQINSRNVYLIGEAAREGMFPINNSTTILQLIAEAGGLRDFAKRKGIYVLRKVAGKQVRLSFNYDQVIRGIHSEQNIVLLPGDTVVVP